MIMVLKLEFNLVPDSENIGMLNSTRDVLQSSSQSVQNEVKAVLDALPGNLVLETDKDATVTPVTAP